MGLTLTPLIWLDPVDQFQTMTLILLAHALSAATQDVAIDALCISATSPEERGQYNGWMQAGMLLGRSMMGGGRWSWRVYRRCRDCRAAGPADHLFDGSGGHVTATAYDH